MRAKPPCEVLKGAGAVPTMRNPKKILPPLSAVIGVLTKTAALKAAALPS
jgi:hypothetical protein